MVLKQLVPQVLIKKCFKFQGYGHIASDCLDHKIVVVIEEEITNKDDLPNESDQKMKWFILIKVGYLSFNKFWMLFMKIGFVAACYSYCSTNGKVCDINVDSGASANVVSADIVKKL